MNSLSNSSTSTLPSPQDLRQKESRLPQPVQERLLLKSQSSARTEERKSRNRKTQSNLSARFGFKKDLKADFGILFICLCDSGLHRIGLCIILQSVRFQQTEFKHHIMKQTQDSNFNVSYAIYGDTRYKMIEIYLTNLLVSDISITFRVKSAMLLS